MMLRMAGAAIGSMALILAACGSSDDGAPPGSSPADCSAATPANGCAGTACKAGTDCASGNCVASVCRDSSVGDGVKDGSETDVDCGGSGAPGCASGLACVVPTDCQSKICSADHKCTAPSATDGIQNGDESDIDCGGTTTNAPRCGLDKKCAAHADCQSSACSYKHVCIAFKSCTAHHGGDSCGPGEDDAGHESCCTTIPGSPLDKYNITAGRFRQFVERQNGDLRGWATASAPSGWNHDWDQFLPTMLDNGGVTPDDDPPFSGVYQELGPNVHGKAGASNEGCFIGGTGARTYWLPDDVNARMNDKQQYPQDVLDDKMMNCVTSYMLAAFCAWDGGRLPTREEWNAAWGSATYPWGSSPAPAGWPAALTSDPAGNPAASPANGDPKRANYNFNYWVPATRVENDYTLYIAPPGRFPTGNGPKGHSDLAGSVFQYEDILGTTTNWSKSGSWQGHSIPFNTINPTSKNKYWATGGRCAR
jgi:formylglycine-generating enzyme required for sulfatase activity